MKMITPGFRKAMGYSVLGVLAIYVVVGLWLITSPRAVLLSRKLTKYYRWAALPGPFFKEERIYTPGHFYVSCKKADGGWSAFRNPEAEQVERYRHSFFNYNSLQQARVAHFMGRALYSAWRKEQGAIVQSGALQQMHAHLRREYIPEDADSVKMLYLRDVMTDDSKQRDTVFQFTYKSH